MISESTSKSVNWLSAVALSSVPYCQIWCVSGLGLATVGFSIQRIVPAGADAVGRVEM